MNTPLHSSLQDECNKATEAPQCCMAARQSGRAVLADVIHRLRRKADNLQALSDMLPAQPSREQDEALWQIACQLEIRG